MRICRAGNCRCFLAQVPSAGPAACPPRLCAAISPTSVLHLIPSDQQATVDFCKAHSLEDEILRPQYIRNMLNLDEHPARSESYGWVLAENGVWIQHEGLGVVVAVTGPKTLWEYSAVICANANLESQAMSFSSYDSVQKLLRGVRPRKSAMRGAARRTPVGTART